MFDNESDDGRDGRFGFTMTAATMAEMTNVNDKSLRILALTPSEYHALRSNDVSFLLDTYDPNEKLSR